MKSKLLVFIMLSLSFGLSTQAEAAKQSINDGWKFRQARQGNWHEAKVPGEVHTDLMREGIIDDPFFALNERGVQWVDKEDWIYETSFVPSKEVLEQNNIDMVFNGLDTYADVYLNDSLILKADNIFRRWNVPVKNMLKEGTNVLRIYFHSPIKVDIPKFDSLDFFYEAINDQSENGGVFDKRVSVFARKAGYHYGWDWGPRLVTSGIWRPISLEGWSNTKIDNLFIETQKITDRKASVNATLSIRSEQSQKKCKIEFIDLSTDKKLHTKTISLKEGINNILLPFDISNPRLWWCNGLGKPDLYDIRCNVIVAGKAVASATVTTGIRTVEIVRENDTEGTSFYFKLNGTPVFAKGANYIPCDNFLSRVTKEIYERTIKDAADVNMNMLRVWGGGIYEDDYFYELCDRYGIMVWQDFMFACSLYPAEGAMLKNIRQEAIDNVVRLRNHPSIVIWCGNNECLEAWHGWSWKTRYAQQGVDSIIWKQYDTLFHKELPAVVAKYSPKTFYWPSSPFSRYDGIAEPDKGDFHLWTVWGQSKPIEDYNRIRSRFFSEYGFQSFPTIETVKKYAPDPKDWDINSDVMLAHQRGGQNANNRIKNYLDASYPQPKDFQSLLYMTQILQGDAIRIAIEAHRRDKPYCMGSLFWQHNDCWPVASWSSRDYYGNWKAQHYFARKAFDDILLSNVISDNTLSVYAISDRKTIVNGILRLSVLTLDGNVIFREEKKTTIPIDGVEKIVYDLNAIVGNNDKSKLIVVSEYNDDSDCYESISAMLTHKEMDYTRPNITWSAKEANGEKFIELTTDVFVRGLFLSLPDNECRYSDNFFDLLPGRTITVKLTTDCSLDYIRKNITLTHLFSATEAN